MQFLELAQRFARMAFDIIWIGLTDEPRKGRQAEVVGDRKSEVLTDPDQKEAGQSAQNEQADERHCGQGDEIGAGWQATDQCADHGDGIELVGIGQHGEERQYRTDRHHFDQCAEQHQRDRPPGLAAAAQRQGTIKRAQGGAAGHGRRWWTYGVHGGA